MLISASLLEKNSVGYLGTVSKIGNVLKKTVGNSLNDKQGWNHFVTYFLEEQNKAESLVLGQGVFKVQSNLELPEVEDEFFDAIEGPEDYIVPLGCWDNEEKGKNSEVVEIEEQVNIILNEKIAV